MRVTDRLQSEFSTDWNAATDHVFCKELADGTLPVEKMKWYLAQDYKFVDRFVRLLATTIAHAPTLADSIPAAQFIALVTGPENTYFLRSFEALNMTPEEQTPPTAPSTLAFQDLMHEAQVSGRYEQMLAVLVVAEWSYLTWANRYLDYSADLPFWFSEWIDLHSGDGFESVVEYLRSQLDQVWGGLSDQQKANASNMFARAVKCERDFFDASYNSHI